MKIYTWPSPEAEDRLNEISKRSMAFQEEDIARVSKILDDVRENGDDAVIRYANKFDSPDLILSEIKVSDSEIEAAIQQVDPEIKAAIERAADQVSSFHQKQVQQSWFTTDRSGTLLGQIVNPVDAAGIYVPGGQGGKTPLVSSVLMTGIPAKIAGVKNIVMVTPPRSDGSIHPCLLYAARIVGVNSVFKIGSAWAVAALAFGTTSVPKVDVIVGPGNIYVTLAKKLVSGTVGIDMIAGPSEILIIADDSTVPEYAAADLLSQAEHDILSSSIMITTSAEIAEAVSRDVDEQLAVLDRKDIAASALETYGAIIVVTDLDTAFDLSNRVAPEHLELHLKEPLEHIGRIRNAGAVFTGSYTPEPVGDYIAGPNHVLPTAGTARFSSALSVDHFIKRTSIVHYSKEAFLSEAEDIIKLAQIEGLDAHAVSVSVRLKR